MYITYILKCADDTYYVGKTTNLTKRLRQHNGEIQGGAKYTSGRRPVVLKFSESYKTNQEACLREYNLKQMTKTEKHTLCEAYSPST